jgi:hypothetical protein
MSLFWRATVVVGLLDREEVGGATTRNRDGSSAAVLVASWAARGAVWRLDRVLLRVFIIADAEIAGKRRALMKGYTYRLS